MNPRCRMQNTARSVPLLHCNWAKLVVDTQFSKQINVFWPLLKEFKARRCEAHGDTQIFATCGRQKSASTAEFSTSTAEKSKRLAENPSLGLSMNRPHCAIIPHGNFAPRIGEMPFGQRGRKFPYLLTHTPHRCAELPYLMGAVPCGLSVISLHCAITPHGNFSPRIGEMPSGQRGRKVL